MTFVRGPQELCDLQTRDTRRAIIEPLDSTTPDRVYCWKCHRAKKVCLCEAIRPIECWPRFLFLMHPKENRLRTGTGRIAHLSLCDSELLIGVDFTESDALNRLLEDEAYWPVLLYPGKDSVDLTQDPPPWKGRLEGQRPLVIVIDGTWHGAKKMIRLSENLHHLPRVSFQSSRLSRFRFKRQPHPACLSTAESVDELLNVLDTWGEARVRPEANRGALLDAMDQMVRLQVSCASDPQNPGYRTSGFQEFRKSRRGKRAARRSIFFVEVPPRSDR